MGLDQLRQFHELRQEHKRDRKIIEEQQQKLAELSQHFTDRINSLHSSLEVILNHLGLQPVPQITLSPITVPQVETTQPLNDTETPIETETTQTN